MDCRRVIGALADELRDIAARLQRLQDSPLGAAVAGTKLEGEDLMAAIVALQDLDRLHQDAAALGDFGASLGGCDDIGPSVKDNLSAMKLRSVAERLHARMA